MSGITQDDIWGTAGIITEPSQPEKDEGFTCDPETAKPDWFNYLMNLLTTCAWQVSGALATWKPGSGNPPLVLDANGECWLLAPAGDSTVDPLTPAQTDWIGPSLLHEHQDPNDLVALAKPALMRYVVDPNIINGYGFATDGSGDAALGQIPLLFLAAFLQNAEVKVNSVTGTTAGGPDGRTFDNLQVAINFMPRSGSFKIILETDVTHADGGDFLIDDFGGRRWITIEGDQETRKIIRPAGIDSVMRISGGNFIEFKNLTYEWGASSNPTIWQKPPIRLTGPNAGVSFNGNGQTTPNVQALDAVDPLISVFAGVGHLGSFVSDMQGLGQDVAYLGTNANLFYNPFIATWTGFGTIPNLGINP